MSTERSATPAAPSTHRTTPHAWQTQWWTRVARRVGRHWVLSRHVPGYCRPLAVAGSEHLRNVRGPAIIIANHTSRFDTPVALSVLPERLRAGRRWRRRQTSSTARASAHGGYSLFWNAYPIERGGGRAALDYSLKLLHGGWAILMYPEGTRSTTGELQPFRHGVAIVAMTANVPVIPIYSEGLRDIMPKGERHPRPGAVRVRIGPRLWLDDVSSVPEATTRLEDAMRGLARTPERGAPERARELSAVR